MGVWAAIDKLIADGKGAVLTLKPEWEVKLPRRRRRNPPRTHRNRPWERYLGSTTGTNRPRCRARGCNDYLKKTQPIACSPACEESLIRESLRTLALLHYRIIERLDDFELSTHGDVVAQRLTRENLL